MSFCIYDMGRRNGIVKVGGILIIYCNHHGNKIMSYQVQTSVIKGIIIFKISRKKIIQLYNCFSKSGFAMLKQHPVAG